MLVHGRPFRTFNVIDDFARDVLTIEIDFSISGGRVVRVLEQLCGNVPVIFASDR